MTPMATENLLDRLERVPGALSGRLTIRGLRVTADHIIGLLAQGWSREQILQEFPELEPADIDACELFALRRILEAKPTGDGSANLDADEDMRDAIQLFAGYLASRVGVRRAG